MSDIGLTIGYDEDKCSICEKKKEVRYIYDTKNCVVAKVCDDCVSKNKDMSINKILKEYGKKTKRRDIELLTKKQLEKSGFDTFKE